MYVREVGRDCPASGGGSMPVTSAHWRQEQQSRAGTTTSARAPSATSVLMRPGRSRVSEGRKIHIECLGHRRIKRVVARRGGKGVVSDDREAALSWGATTEVFPKSPCTRMCP